MTTWLCNPVDVFKNPIKLTKVFDNSYAEHQIIAVLWKLKISSVHQFANDAFVLRRKIEIRVQIDRSNTPSAKREDASGYLPGEIASNLQNVLIFPADVFVDLEKMRKLIRLHDHILSSAAFG